MTVGKRFGICGLGSVTLLGAFWLGTLRIGTRSDTWICRKPVGATCFQTKTGEVIVEAHGDRYLYDGRNDSMWVIGRGDTFVIGPTLNSVSKPTFYKEKCVPFEDWNSRLTQHGYKVTFLDIHGNTIELECVIDN